MDSAGIAMRLHVSVQTLKAQEVFNPCTYSFERHVFLDICPGFALSKPYKH